MSTNFHPAKADRWLARSAQIWFGVALLGQLAFVLFIVGFYGTRTLVGDFEGWNDKELITGHVQGDFTGNLMFALHVLLAVVISIGGVLQLIPRIRNRFRGFHRWNGRVFMLVAFFLALGGLWMTWVRGSHLSVISGVSVSLNAVLILVFATLALRHARSKKFARHRQWALRTFMVVNGVWFFRLGIMAWVLINQGPVGMNHTLSGPADIVLSFGSYLIPLAVLELYLIAQAHRRQLVKVFATVGVGLATVITAVGVFGATAFMWWPVM